MATASRARDWLLVEQPGPWGTDALLESRFPKAVARELGRRARDRGIRVVLLRGGAPPDAAGDTARRRVYLAHTGSSRTSPWLEEAALDDPADLLDVDLEPLLEGRTVGLGRALDGPLYLVCTNGRHDACCAERGRPLFRAMANAFPVQTWECSHVGGDRFAGNLVCFPHGIYYGWVGADDAAGIARAYADGWLALEHYRGRSSYPVAVQAAERFVRAATGLAGIGDLRFRSRTPLPDGLTEVGFAGPDGTTYLVSVRVTRQPVARRLTCAGEHEARPNAFQLISLKTNDPAGS